MTTNKKYIKGIFSLLIIGSLFSITFAATTSKQGRDILNQLKSEGRSDEIIKATMEDLGLDTSGYFPKNSTTTTSSITSSSTTKNTSNNKTTKQGRDILNQLKSEGRSDEIIKATMEDLGLDTSGYFPDSNKNNMENNISNSSYSNSNNNNESVYTSRSCKVYNIEYEASLGVYTSRNLVKKEYFINPDYFKRYVDSKNPQISGCPVNGGWISTSYIDSSNSSTRYTAPNGKVYFITNQNGSYTSKELNTTKTFPTLNELKNYIKDRNPLISMGAVNNTNNTQNTSISNIWNEIFN